jgi:hypothetical protein
MAGLADAINGVAGQPASMRVGRVDSLNPLVVTAQGVPFEDVGVLGPYIPQLGDQVALIGQSSEAGSDPASWLALGAITAGGGRQLLLTKLRQTTLQNVPISTFTPVPFQVADVDTIGAWDPALPDRFTAPWYGWYVFSGGFSFAPNAAGDRQGVWLRNSGSLNDNFVTGRAPATQGTRMAMRTYYELLNPGDVIQMSIWQDAVNPLATQVGFGVQSSLNARYLGAAPA